MNPTEADAAMLQSVTFDAPPRRHVYLRVEPGLVSTGEFVLGSTSDAVVPAPRYPKEAAIAQDGALLPLTGNRLLTIYGRGVEAIKVDVQQLLPGSINHLASQTGGDIRDPWFRYGIDADNLSVLTTRIIELNPGHPRERKFATLDLDPFLPAGGLFFVKVQGWDPETQRTVGPYDRRMALVTDLGLLVKTNVDQSQHVFVHSIATGEPVSGAEVDLLGKNGLAVISTTTDADGHARLASAADFQRDRQPTVFVVRRDTDVTFMPYRRGDRRIRWSGFDVGGEHSFARRGAFSRRGVTDRGLYRPGRDIRLFSIVRTQRPRRGARRPDRGPRGQPTWCRCIPHPHAVVGRRVLGLGRRHPTGIAHRTLRGAHRPRRPGASAHTGRRFVARRGIPARPAADPCRDHRPGAQAAGSTANRARNAPPGVAEPGRAHRPCHCGTCSARRPRRRSRPRLSSDARVAEYSPTSGLFRVNDPFRDPRPPWKR